MCSKHGDYQRIQLERFVLCQKCLSRRGLATLSSTLNISRDVYSIVIRHSLLASDRKQRFHCRFMLLIVIIAVAWLLPTFLRPSLEHAKMLNMMTWMIMSEATKSRSGQKRSHCRFFSRSED